MAGENNAPQNPVNSPEPTAPAAAPAPAADPAALDADGFSQAERDFFSSRGTKTEGLGVPEPAPGATPAAPAAPGAVPAAATPGASGAVAPAAEETPDDDDDIDPSKPPPKKVNWAKYRRAAEKAKTVEKEFADYRAKSAAEQATVTERLKIINEALTTPAQQQQQEEQDPEPDPDKDFIAHNAWLGRQVSRQNQLITEMREAETARGQEREIAQTYNADAENFAATHETASKMVTTPSGARASLFALAYVHLMQNRMKELETYGVTDVNERRRIVNEEERDLVQRALAARKTDPKASPAERIWNLALGRGFDPNNPMPGVAPAAAAPATNGAGKPAIPGALGGPAPAPAAAAPAAVPAAAAAPSVSEELKRIQNGQAASMSLSAAGGGAGDELTPEKLANMDQETFAAVLSKLSKTRQRELLGT